MGECWTFRPFYNGSNPEPILRDVFNGWNLGAGIFNYLAANATLPWAEDTSVYNDVLDIAYFGNHSGGKFCSPLVKLSIDDETGYVTSEARTIIAKILISKYLTNWQHLWETNKAVYSPIHNYDMTENRMRRTADSESELIDRTEEETIGSEDSTDTTDYKYGLNTVINDPKPSDASTNHSEGSTETSSGINSNRNRVGAGEEEEEIHRAGNIGVTTTQKLLQEERELWIWNYFDQVFNDLDRELALMFHDSCRV